MSRWTDLLLGAVVLEITGADIPGTLSRLNEGGIRIRDLHPVPPISIRLTLYPWQLARAQKLLSRRGDHVRVLRREGILPLAKRHRSRLPLAICLAFLTAFFLWLPSRVLFVEVEGTERIPAEEIRAAAEKAGLTFFCKGGEIRNEQLKNILLQEIPELQWAGVNFNGSVARVTVRERITEASPHRQEDISDVVASRDGIVVSISVLEGETRCRIGQAVRQGEMLVSGYIEHPYQPQYTHSHAEVYALTQHPVDAVHPAEALQKEPSGSLRHRYSLLIGRKRINLSGNSGIPTATCDKMYTQKYVTLPGGFRLPLGLCVETWIGYTVATVPVSSEAASSSLGAFARRDVTAQMLAGEILCGEETVEQDGENYILNVNYTCREMIARQRTLYLFEGERTNDGTYHKRRAGGGSHYGLRLPG